MSFRDLTDNHYRNICREVESSFCLKYVLLKKKFNELNTDADAKRKLLKEKIKTKRLFLTEDAIQFEFQNNIAEAFRIYREEHEKIREEIDECIRKKWNEYILDIFE